MAKEDMHIIVIGSGITGLLAGIKYSCFEKDVAMNYRSNEWTMAIHWALPLLKRILPPSVFSKMNDIACNPTLGVHSGLYPIINGSTGDLIAGVPYENGLRVARSKMRALCAEGIDVRYSKTLAQVRFGDGHDAHGVTATFNDGTTVTGSLILGADGPRSKVREIAMGSVEEAAVTKFPIFHTNMTVCYNDAEKSLFARKQYPTSYLALSPQNFHAFQSISSMPDGVDHPESWVFHMAMAWMGEVDNSLSYKDRLALIKERAETMGEPSRSAFLWIPEDTEVHKAEISYWVSRPWSNFGGRLSLVGDAAHPMPPYRGQGLNHCICDVSHILQALAAVRDGQKSLGESVDIYEDEVIPRGKEEVSCSVENGIMLHDWSKAQQSPVFKRGFKPMDGHEEDARAAEAAMSA